MVFEMSPHSLRLHLNYVLECIEKWNRVIRIFLLEIDIIVTVSTQMYARYMGNLI